MQLKIMHATIEVITIVCSTPDNLCTLRNCQMVHESNAQVHSCGVYKYLQFVDHLYI